jgi:Fe-S-cluster-containing hydrogenase component 2
MLVQVNQEKCSGCEACLTECSVNAISLDSGKATIDQALCTGCAACLNICPSGAIYAEAEPVQIVPAVERPAAKARPVLISGAPRTLAPWAGATLAFVGREVAPRLADALIAALERRLARATSLANESSRQPASSGRPGGAYRHRKRKGSS